MTSCSDLKTHFVRLLQAKLTTSGKSTDTNNEKLLKFFRTEKGKIITRQEKESKQIELGLREDRKKRNDNLPFLVLGKTSYASH
jgi:hypothetical protein